ncbi:MAG: ABC transporter ATP-binding protein [Thermoleophilia bacterium]|nr:ABC transporter ATP-binding protein [Thermoleophilia bacterium]
MSATIVVDRASKWFGDTVAMGDVSFEVGAGVTGLLGHNGAGKSTLLKLLAGFSRPDEGTVRVLGHDPGSDVEVYRRLGVVPDGDGLWPHMTARAAIAACARMRGVPDPADATRRVLERVDMTGPADRRLGGFSKGMKQRIKVAQALVHGPEVLLLDEPLNGLDPAQRRDMIDLVGELGASGHTVLVSSHQLGEVERMAPNVLVMVNGRLVAEGTTGGIRDLLAERPRTLRVEVDAPPEVARALIGEGLAQSVRLEDGALVAETGDLRELSRRLPAIARDAGTTLRGVEPVGEDLESVYAYLTARARGAGR